MALFKNKYRVETARLKTWDYGKNAAYFVTICTKGREHFFGKIQNEEMILNEAGIIVQNEWLRTPIIRPDMNLRLDEFVVMPNHFHGIICIGKNQYNSCNDNANGKMVAGGNGTKDSDATDDGDTIRGRDARHRVSTANENSSLNKFGPQSKNLASIIRGFKSSVSKQARRSVEIFVWQERYHDHIIRDHESYLRIQQYILSNPANWKEDRFYSE
jgi:REP-associated tyrosine transposase